MTWRMLSDLHTHTIYSSLGHGKGTIEENVLAARKKGLKTIGISDHGPDHIAFGLKKSYYFKIRQEIEHLKQKYRDIEILLGVEANIINRSGKLAMSDEELGIFDYVMAGYHFGTVGESAGFSLSVHAMNGLGGSARSEKRKAVNTEIVMRTLEENKIAVLTHPGCKGEILIREVAELCAERGTLLEINDSHGYLNAEQIKEAARTDVRFIIGSDAHRPQKVGSFENGLAAAMEAGIDMDRIVNIRKRDQMAP